MTETALQEGNTPDGFALGLGIVLMVPGAVFPLALLRMMEWHEPIRDAGFPQNHWLFVGPLILVMPTIVVSFLRGRRQAAQYAAIIFLQAAWYECAALAASWLLSAVTPEPSDTLSVALLSIFAAPGFLAGIATLRRWGIVRHWRRGPREGLDIEMRMALILPVMLLGFLLVDLAQALGMVPAQATGRDGMSGIILMPGIVAIFGAYPATGRHWAVLAGTMAGMVTLSVAVWAITSAVLFSIATSEITQLAAEILPEFLPIILALPMQVAARKLAGTDSPWQRREAA